MMIGETQDQTDKMLLYSEGFLNYVKSVENDQLFKTGQERRRCR